MGRCLEKGLERLPRVQADPTQAPAQTHPIPTTGASSHSPFVGLQVRSWMHLQVVKVCGFAAVGALFFGIDLSNWAGASNKEDFLELFCWGGGFDLTPEGHANCLSGVGSRQSQAWANAVGLMAGALQMGAATASLVVAPIVSDQFGRKCCLWTGCGVGTAGITVACLSRTVQVMVVGRFVLGMGAGLVSYGLPMYTSEVSPKDSRGAMTSLFQLFTAVGVVIGAVINVPRRWPWWVPFAVPVVPAGVLAIGLLFLPESPRWLLKQNRYDEAMAVLTYLRSDTPGVPMPLPIPVPNPHC